MRKRNTGSKRWQGILFTIVLLLGTFLPHLGTQTVQAQIAEDIVISQVYGGGGNSGAFYKNDFIELYNPTGTAVSLDGWSVQYTSAAGTSWTNITPLSGTIKAYGYYLIQEAAGTGGTEALPTPDASGAIAMSGTAGKVALVNTTVPLAGALPTGVVDFVGFGTTANGFEGSGPTKNLSATLSAQRLPYAAIPLTAGLGNGWDTDDNGADFATAAPKPRNSESPTEKFEMDETVQPIASRIQFIQEGTQITVTAEEGTVPDGATVKFYENTSGAALAEVTAGGDGSFGASFTSEQALTKLYITATTDKPESNATVVDVAKVTASLTQGALSYMVDGQGNGTLIGTKAALSKAQIYVYSDEEAVNRLNPTDGQPVFANATGDFSTTFKNAPDTVYVTQQNHTANGIMLESVSVSITKASNESIATIEDVRKSDAQGKPVNLNKFFTIEGVVTFENGVLGAQKNNFFIQDETAGINVFGSFDHNLKINRGDRLKVTGKVIYYNGLTEFEPTAVLRINEGDVLPTPVDVTIVDMNTFNFIEPLEGSLATVSGKVTNSVLAGTGYNVTIADDNAKTTLLRVMIDTKIDMDTQIVTNKSYTFTGVIGQYTTKVTANDGYQLFPRDSRDIASILGLSHEGLATAYKDTNITFEAFADGAQSVTVFYRNIGDGTYSDLPMSGDPQGRYTAVLDHTKITGEEFEYYIEAKAGEKSKFAGTSGAPFKVALVEDKEGPNFYAETPDDGSKVETSRPEISVLMEDPSGVDESSVEVYLDGEKITDAFISKTQVKFTPSTDLEIAVHRVKVSAKDMKGNLTEKEWTFEVVPRFTGGTHYRGTTHNHTNISHDGTGNPVDAVKAGLKYGYDFFAFSDHSHDIDPTLLGQDTVDRDGLQERTGGADWKLTKDLAAEYTKDGEYVVFPSFEMTATTWGHANVFGTENFIDRNVNGKLYQDLSKFYAWVLTYDDVVAQFNHPDMGKGAFNDFKPYDKEVDKLFTMFEVGNGSGHYAYANAENKYFSALDLGWHVAPTYGEDNHDGSWGQTNARTVIVSEDLTNDSLLHSMRNMRVYMTEDPNFEMDVLANDYYMGSTVDSKTLQFDISGKDLVAESKATGYDYLSNAYQSDDRVKSVELLSNGGKVVDSYSPMTNDFNWNPSYTVASGQQWFVVRVTQMDGERAYSAPIWSKEESVDLKVNSIDIEGGVVIEGNPATFKTVVGNFGTQTINDVNVDLYLNEVKVENLIGSNKIPSIVAKGTGVAAVKWEKPTAGNYDIIAVVTMGDGTDLGDIQFTLPVQVKQPLGITVLIDAKHGNENTSGDGGTYKDNLKDFILLLQKEGYKVEENKVAITADVLKDVQVLAISQPRTALTADEQKAVADFVKAGSSLLLLGKSNNGSTDSTINNELLAQIGTEIRTSHDGVFDLSKKGNFWSDPTVSPFAVRAYPDLVDNYVTDRVPFIDYYSGSSLQGPNNTALTESGKVVFLAKGNETTYQGNVKNGSFVYDDVSDDHGGSAIPLIASDEIGDKGRIIVSGMNIFNDKQMDESYEPKGNVQFLINTVNWLAHRDTKITDIGDARKLAEDTDVVIEGTVTTAAGVFFDAFYLEDETGGIMAFNEVPEGSLVLGDKVRIYGHIITFDNNKEIAFSDFDVDVIKLGRGDLVQPKEVATGSATSDENQGLLVKITGKVISIADESSYFINDGSGELLVFVDGYIANQSGPIPSMKIGDTLEAVGLSGEFAGGQRIRVRDTKELKVTPNALPTLTLAVTPNTLALKVGDTGQLEVKAILTYGDGKTTESIVTTDANYTSGDDKVVTVNNGTVKAIGAGNAMITVSHKDVVATVSVLVTKKDEEESTESTKVLTIKDLQGQLDDKKAKEIDIALPQIKGKITDVRVEISASLLREIIKSKKDVKFTFNGGEVIAFKKVMEELEKVSTGNVSFYVKVEASDVIGAITPVYSIGFLVEKGRDVVPMTSFQHKFDIEFNVDASKVKDAKKLDVYESGSNKSLKGKYKDGVMTLKTEKLGTFYVK
ncbi:CehA/McbA family metallohydrolase [Sporosarcina sp. FA9]|uniref:CehA/McbA family metallohydrolase n=1 Tax=Sporosarcina sp. FA9 TaxID=3413030 RepID=UPI003F65E6E0